MSAIVVGTVLGCSTQNIVFDPPPTTTPNQPTSMPVFAGAANQAATPPLPISGGTLLTVTHADGSAIVLASDPDEDAIHVASLGASPAMLGTLQLQPGDEPGRLVADSGGRVHVVLRGSGSIATIVPTATGASLVMKRSVCSAPRGIDYEPTSDSIYVACATGELVALPAAGGDATLHVQLDRDLRDVVIDGKNLYITRFRSAEILTLDLKGILANRTLPALPANIMSASQPDVAWRALRNPSGGGIRVVYQVASTAPIDVAQPPGVSSYGGTPTDMNQGGSVGGVVSVAVASLGGTGSMTAGSVVANPVVDLAVSPTGAPETIGIGGAIESQGGLQLNLPFEDGSTSGKPDAYVAIADAQSASTPVIVAQRRGATPALVIVSIPANSPLSSASVSAILPLHQNASHVDTGFDVFHIPTTAGVACMNCHPEGGDDSHTWTFSLASGDRVRRTQSLRGGVISSTAPYHWDGDMTDLQKLCDEVFTHRMGGGAIMPAQTPALARFVNAMPRIPVRATLDQDRVQKGAALFNGTGACNSCHTNASSSLSSNQSIGKIDQLGSSPALQVPMLLGVADRAPYMHDGCAPTLLSRFTDTKCAGSAHGNTSQLSDDDRQNLVEYLESL